MRCKTNRFSLRSGQVLSKCFGGLQILVDLKNAFDLVSREAIGRALLALALPQEVIAILMAWYYETPYHILHLEHEGTIPGNSGVRQGCVAAPFLWTAYILEWQKKLAGIYGNSWVLEHVTTYADDHHAAWEFEDEEGLVRSLAEATQFLKSLEEDGMKISLLKTQALLLLRGTSSRSLLKRYTCAAKNGRQLRLGLSEDAISLPLVHQARYLGIHVSYSQSLSKCTLQHRQRQARASYFQLRPWWGRGKLPLNERFRLWDTCIWPSLTFGIYEVGLTPSLCLRFRKHVLRNYRAIAHTAVHLSHEPTSVFLRRIGRPDPVCQLAHHTVIHWARRIAKISMSHPADVLHRALVFLNDQFAEASDFAYWLYFCVLLVGQDQSEVHEEGLPVLRLMCTQLSENILRTQYAPVLQMIGKERDARTEMTDVPMAEPFRCEICLQCFPSSAGLRKHQTRIHALPVAQKAQTDQELRKLGVDGMPVCPYCAQTFQDWRRFCRHMREDVCRHDRRHLLLLHEPVLPHLLPGDPDRDWLRRPVPQGAACFDQPGAPPCLEAVKPSVALCMQDDFQLCQSVSHDWRQVLLDNPTLRERLDKYCVLCNMWCPHSMAIMRRQCTFHPEMHKRANDLYVSRLEGERLITGYCRYCGFTSKAASKKAQNRTHKCGLIVQLAALKATHADRDGTKCGSSSRPRDDDVQGTSPQLGCKPRSGRPCRGGAEEETATSRRRICRKSRPQIPESSAAEPPQTTTSQSEAPWLQFGLTGQQRRPHSASSPGLSLVHQTGGYAQLIEAGYGDDSAHGYRFQRVSRPTSESGRFMERKAAPTADLSNKPTATHTVPLSLGGVPNAPNQASHSSLHRRDVATSSKQWSGRQGVCIHISDLECRDKEVGGHHPEAPEVGGCAVSGQDLDVAPNPRHHPSLSFSAPLKPDNELQDGSLPPRDWTSSQSGGSCPSTSVRPCAELVPYAHRSSVEALNSPTVCSMPRDQDEDRKDRRNLDDVQALSGPSSRCPSQNIAQIAFTGQPSTKITNFLSHTYVNTGVVCYMNAVTSAIGWCWCHLSDPEVMGRFHRMLHHLLAEKVRILLLDPEYGSAMRHWHSPHIQHDIAEFWGHLMNHFSEDVGGIFIGSWVEIEDIGSPIHPVQVIRSTNSLKQALVIPLQPGLITLQHLVDCWHKSSAESLFANAILKPVPLFLFVQLECFTWDSVQACPIKISHKLHAQLLSEVVIFPCCSADAIDQYDYCHYCVHAALMHHGDNPQGGHYTVLMKMQDGWMHRDDERQKCYPAVGLPWSLIQDVYCLVLRRTGSSSTSSSLRPS